MLGRQLNCQPNIVASTAASEESATGVAFYRRVRAMNKSSPTSGPPLGAAVASVVLGAVGVLLFFLPILSIPLSGIGVVFGLVGIVWTLRGDARSLRWAIAGLVVSAAALGAGITIAKAAAGRLQTPTGSLDVDRMHAQPYVPPPARIDQ